MTSARRGANLAAALCTACLAARVVTSAVLAAQGQAPATPGTGLIVGHLVDAGSNVPIVNAIVSLTGGGIPTRRVIVDSHGRFMFSELPAGAFTIGAKTRGYLDSAYGQLRPDGLGRPLDLREGERVTDVRVRMWRFATISGTVTDDAGDPVSGANVQVWRRTIVAGHWRLTYAGQSEYADERGAYRIISLPPGDYAVVITSLTSTLPVALLTATATAKNSEGAVRDDFYRLTNTNGTGGFVNDLAQGFATVRIGDLLLQGGGGGAPTMTDGHSVNVYPTVWYPSASTPALATIISLSAGDNRTGIDLHATLTPTFRISGTVMAPDGPVTWLSLRLVPAALDDVSAEVTTSLSQSFNVAMTASDGNGAFTFLAVPPGQYIIRALTIPRPLPEPQAAATVIQTADGMSHTVSSAVRLPPMLSKDPSLWTAAPVSVGDQDVAGVAVTMRPGLHVTGRVEFDGATIKPVATALRAIRVSLQPADGRTVWDSSAYQAQVDPNGDFYTAGLMAGSYVLRVDSPPSGWSVKSAMVAGHDISDTALVLESRDVSGLVLTFTDHPTHLGGTVRDGQGRADDNAAVVIFPSDGGWVNLGASARRLRTVGVSRTGLYATSGLPPGSYDVIAIGDGLPSNWQDPAWLERLSHVASQVTIGDGQSQSLDLTTMVVR
jgi:hypothetical protein